MRRARSFRDMDTAPIDGRIVELCDGLSGKVVLAYWHDRTQGWVDDNDHGPARRALRFIIGWRPVAEAGARIRPGAPSPARWHWQPAKRR